MQEERGKGSMFNMATMDVFLSNFLFKIIGLVVVICLVVRFFRTRFRRMYEAFYVVAINRLTPQFNKVLGKHKEKLFSIMQESAHGKPTTILEVGAGAGVNFQYYPDKSFVICVEPKKSFEQFFDANASNHPRLRVEFVTGVAEDMRNIPTGSVDAVVVTLVLCSVKDVNLALQEILRVLKPGGRFYYVEHVRCKGNGWITKLQCLLTPMSRWLVDNCHLNRKIWEQIDRAGFSTVNYDFIQGSRRSLILKNCLVGWAMK